MGIAAALRNADSSQVDGEEIFCSPEILIPETEESRGSGVTKGSVNYCTMVPVLT